MLLPFEYYAPESVHKAAEILSNEKDRAKLIMGGTDLVVQMEERIVNPEVVIDLSGIPELKKISEDDLKVEIGSALTHAEVEEWASEKPAFTALLDASSSVGTPQVRNLATLMGNLCTAVPSADLGAPVLVLDGILKIVKKGSSREVKACDFFMGPKKTVLEKDEIVTAIYFPQKSNRGYSRYFKLGPRNSSDLAIVGVAASLVLSEDNLIEKLKVGLCAVAPTPMLVYKTESFIGLKYDSDIPAKCGKMAGEACRPISDLRASADYRRQMVEFYAAKAVSECAEAIMGGRHS